MVEHVCGKARRLRVAAIAVLTGWLVVMGVAGPLAGRLSAVERNDTAAFLPREAEATKVLRLQQGFARGDVLGAVVVYERADRLTPGDRAAVAGDLRRIAWLPGVAGPVPAAVTSADGHALQAVVPLDAADLNRLTERVSAIRRMTAGHPGLSAHVTGPAGLNADFMHAFDGVDTTLLATTAIVVVAVLLLVYRSPLLWLAPLVAAGISLVLAQAFVYLAARHFGLEVNGQSQGILTVLVFGAGTDYALLLISRYREELRRHESRYAAMGIAWRRVAPPIAASAVTVMLGLLCLLASELTSNRSLGPVAAIGIACALAVMLTLLPALLILLGRPLFFPFVPRPGRVMHAPTQGWARAAARLGRRPRAAWILVTLLLGAGALASGQLRADGLAQAQLFPASTDSVQGQRVLSRHFAGGTGAPAVVIGPADAAASLLATVRATPGVATAQLLSNPAQPPRPRMVHGRIAVAATVAALPDSPQAEATVKRLRRRAHAVPDARALVGGFTAVHLDAQDAARRDRTIVPPLTLLVTLGVLALLLRALVAPVLLLATVVLSYAATLGVCALAFNYLFGFPGADSSFPLFAFVFLVALGIDYNIFLVTRIREEAQHAGTRAGTLRGLTATGSVITSAGIVLAATFAVLGVLPFVPLAELGFAIAFGVLLDALLVRSLLVPALLYDLGPRVWWPSRLPADRTAAAGRSKRRTVRPAPAEPVIASAAGGKRS